MPANQHSQSGPNLMHYVRLNWMCQLGGKSKMVSTIQLLFLIFLEDDHSIEAKIIETYAFTFFMYIFIVTADVIYICIIIYIGEELLQKNLERYCIDFRFLDQLLQKLCKYYTRFSFDFFENQQEIFFSCSFQGVQLSHTNVTAIKLLPMLRMRQHA